MLNLEEIEARAKAATKGQWEMKDGAIISTGFYVASRPIVANVAGNVVEFLNPDDIEFVVHARQDIRDLLVELHRLKRQVIELQRVRKENIDEILEAVREAIDDL